ncbi:MAG TPA: hypothetical protein VFE50_19580 [Cyclobacteriaceae bacterium]|nr:hypothetical protein [Cyclobacteriaceae bacterium]
MVKQQNFIGGTNNLETIHSWYLDQRFLMSALKQSVFSDGDLARLRSDKQRMLSRNELYEYFIGSEKELDYLFSFDMIAAIEGLLRTHFIQKVHEREKSDLGREFRKIDKTKNQKISLEKDIIESWKRFRTDQKKHFSDLLGLLKYRHWLAHGRYWQPKLGRQYDVHITYSIAKNIFDIVRSHR